MLLLEAGIEGITPNVSSPVTSGGEECFTTISLFSPALSASSERERLVSPSDSQWIITGQEFSFASSIPLSRTLSDASLISAGTGK